MIEFPDAIMINVPQAFFNDTMSRNYFERFYTSMNHSTECCFYHFISSVPRFKVLNVYVCYDGKVQFKARIADVLKNAVVETDAGVAGPRNWLVTCGPVIRCPEGYSQKGFRGFRYTKDLF